MVELTPQAKWKKENPEKVKQQKARWNCKSRFGLSLIEYKLWFSEHPFCSICGKDNNLVLDHCHNTNKIRGVLCRKCNSGIGLLQDNIDMLKKAIEYLSKCQLN